MSRVVSEGAEEEVIVRGHRLSELIGRISFAEVMFLLLRGDLPSRHRRASSTPSSSPRRSMGSRRP
jgi:citrate synthase